MLKGEIEIVCAVASNRRNHKQIASSRAAVRSPYILSTIDSLVRTGYLTRNESNGYRLTRKGIQVFASFLPANADLKKFACGKVAREHSERAREAINSIETLGLNYINSV